ncbi:MAG: (Fe-S)-binding protein [Deltaproteobacteria bacterium]|nr:(Fe-S)-binding protein [Candidatus Tharpellaceae bacterium]
MNDDVFANAEELLRTEIIDTVRRCRKCNYCYSACPLFQSTRGFQTSGPSGIIQSLYYGIVWGELEGQEKETLRDILYQCTTCNSCVLTCKDRATGLPIVEVIEKGRKLLVEMMNGPMPSQRKPMEQIYSHGNPYQEAQENRLAWGADLDFKRLPEEKAETLFYVGCTTSYEPELQNVARSLVKIFQHAGVDFGVMAEEKCCGDPVDKMGDMFLYQELVEKNEEDILACGCSQIVTVSPHCFHSFTQSYGRLTAGMEVLHYTMYLERLLADGRLRLQAALPRRITYHDPCYLGKHHDILEEPRNILRQLPQVTLVEMEQHGKDSLCCGGGGGRMFYEVEGNNWLGETRIKQALDVKAEIIVTACPWCHTMLDNAVKNLGVGGQLQVVELAEIVAGYLMDAD